MKKIVILATLVGIILLLSAFKLDQNFSRSYHHLLTNSTNLGDENVDGLAVNDNFYNEKIAEKYGKKTEQSRNIENYDYFELVDGIEVAVNDRGEMTRFWVTGTNTKTAKGINIDDEKKVVVQAYGKDYYVRREQGVEIIGYVDKERSTSLEFWLYDNKVKSFRLDNNPMK